MGNGVEHPERGKVTPTYPSGRRKHWDELKRLQLFLLPMAKTLTAK